MLGHMRVLDLADERGLVCGQILADLGADVIAVEPPGGSTARRLGPFAGDQPEPERSLTWWAFARNKRGMTLDLEIEAGRDQLRRLVQQADVLIESFTPGHMDQLGLGYDSLRALNPGLVMVSISAFGADGPKAQWAASDITVWASSGAMSLTGDDDRPPLLAPGGQGWLHAGAEGAVGALIALTGRNRDGIGRHVDVSAQAASMMATQSMILQAGWGENPVTRVAGGVKAGPIRMQFVHPCKDGFVSVSFLFGTAIGPFTRRLFEWMHEEGFIDAATRDKDWIAYTSLILSGKEPVSELMRCIAAIGQFTRAHTKAELFQAALERKLLIVPVSTTEDVVHSAQLADRDYWVDLAQPQIGSRVRYPGPLAKLSASPIRYHRVAPHLGEHTAEVLAEPPRPAPTPRTVGSAAPALPLAGINVLELAWVVAAPLAARYLADYGATVVHVESSTRPDTARTIQPFKDAQPGPERSGLFANTNAGKRGLTLNLALPAGRAVLKRLVAWADILTESFSPRAMRSWGLGYDTLRQINPGLIMLSSCLNGQTGPWSGLAGFGTMGAQLAGFGALTGWPDRGPAGPFGAYTDYVAPKYTAAVLLAALEHRGRTGEGQYIDFSQAEASIHFLAPALLDYTVNGRVESPRGNESQQYCPQGVYPTEGEDRWLALTCTSEDTWQSLCRLIGRDAWRADPRFASTEQRRAHAATIDTAIAGWTAGHDPEELEQILQAAGIAAHRVVTSADAFADPQLRHRGYFPLAHHQELGPMPIEGSRMRLSGLSLNLTDAGPVYGQHNQQVLRDILGMTDDEIGELAASGALE